MRKLGKLPARSEAIKFKFGAYLNAPALPVPPARFGHYNMPVEWGMLGNDNYSDCVFAGAAHETMIWLNEAGESAVFTETAALADYSDVTGFNMNDPASDSGTDMGDAATYRRKEGIRDANGIRHKIDAYVAITHGDLDQLALATYLFGVTGVGIRMPASADDQFERQVPWSIVPNSPVIGGHYVPCVGRNRLGNYLFITWGRLHAATPEFVKEYMDEGLAYLSLESLKNNLSPEGVNLAQLKSDLAALAA